MPNGKPGKIKLRYLAGDLTLALAPGKRSGLLEGFEVEADEPYLDGPVSRRVAVVDIDAESGQLHPGARFIAPLDLPGKTKGGYQVANVNDHRARDFQQVSAFSTVLATMRLFEEPDVLGRKLRWAFDGEQLLIVPRAGVLANAYYERRSRSLQFFEFDGLFNDQQERVYTCLSPDIVAHETAHAILDGIAPDLYDASSPQALALHEAIADLTAMLFAVRSDRLRLWVMNLTRGDLTQSQAFNTIAEQFGQASSGRFRPLRDLHNDKTMASVANKGPHALSEVLSGALYSFFLKAYAEERQEALTGLDPAQRGSEEAAFQVSGKALFLAGDKLKRMALRALDYLPPGESSFADYARAVIAADSSSNPGSAWERDFLMEECERRGIVAHKDDLVWVKPDWELPADLVLDDLLAHDSLAYRFAENHRDRLFIPAGAPIKVLPRLDVTKTTWRRKSGKASFRELLFKVVWRESQTVQFGNGLVDEIGVAQGTTLAIAWDTRAINAVLTNGSLGPRAGSRDAREHRAMRAAYLQNLTERGIIGPDSGYVETVQGMTRLKRLGALLHMVGGSDDD